MIQASTLMRNERFWSLLTCQRPDYQRIAELFQSPTVKDADPSRYPIKSATPIGLFFFLFCFFVFQRLARVQAEWSVVSYDNQRIYVLMFILRQMYPDRYLFVSQTPNVCFASAFGLTSCLLEFSRMDRLPLSIRALNAGKGVSIDASINGYSKENHTMDIPLATISEVRLFLCTLVLTVHIRLKQTKNVSTAQARSR